MLRHSQFWLFEVLASRSSGNRTAHGRSFYRHASPLDEPPHCEEQQDAEAQDVGPESQIERQDDTGHTEVPERLLDKELKSSAKQEQQADTCNSPSHPWELSVLPSLAVHKITTAAPLPLSALEYGIDHSRGLTIRDLQDK